MAVYERTYRRYAGPLTARRGRFLVLTRYAAREIFASKLTTALVVLSLVVPLGAAIFIYLPHNAGALELLGVDPGELLAVNATFFRHILAIQGSFAFLLTALVAPGLVSPDLAHNALPLYLCRPLSRPEYVVGKMAVLLALLSAVTWVPGLGLFLLKVHLADGWLAGNARIGPALLVGGLTWILVLSLLGLAISAWVRWRTVAAGTLFVVFFAGQALSSTLEGVFAIGWARLFHLGDVVKIIWDGLFFGETTAAVPLWGAWVALTGVCGLCLLILDRKLRAYEVIR